MLVLTLRQDNDYLVIDTADGPVRIAVLKVQKSGKTCIGVDCPPGISVHRKTKKKEDQ